MTFSSMTPVLALKLSESCVRLVLLLDIRVPTAPSLLHAVLNAVVLLLCVAETFLPLTWTPWALVWCGSCLRPATWW